MKRILSLLITIGLYCAAVAQTDSCHVRISLLTCGEGDDLYTAWGHTAVRVTDSTKGTDIIYNYGTFNFEDPDFYVKFVKGKMLYFVSVDDYRDFIVEYQMERRSIIEQLLQLSCGEKLQLSQALQTNAREENKYYFYQFLFDNCATRIRDIFSAGGSGTVSYKRIIPSPAPTFRQFLHVNLDKGNQLWGELGIDLALGSLIDRPPTNQEIMFLPEYLMKGLDSGTINHHPLVANKKTLLPDVRPPQEKSIFTPINTTLALLAIILGISFSRKNWAVRFLNIFDVAIFFITGGIGCFLIFLWFGTGHDLTANNYNLLWALPTHLVASFFVLRDRSWIKKYFLASTIFYLLIIIFWSLIPQGMNPAFLPIAILLGSRSFVRSRKIATHD